MILRVHPMMVHCVGFFVAMICVASMSCSKPTEPTAQEDAAPVKLIKVTPTKLVFDQVLLAGDLQIQTAFADLNRDGKPDMILGSSGHAFSSTGPRIGKSNTLGPYRHFVSHLVNRSSDNEIKFDEPVWPFAPDPHSSDGQLPSG